MLIQIYKFTGSVNSDIRRASLIDEVEATKIPRDQIKFARRYGGDFIEVVEELEAA